MTYSEQVRLAADIGGTFTDVVLETPQGRLTRKVLTTPAFPERGVLNGIDLVLMDAGLGLAQVDVFVHGTTLATNAIIERRGARTALIGTEGFRDILEIGTESRFNQYDLMLQKPVPLVPRPLRFTVPERIDARGQIRRPLDEQAVRALLPELRDMGTESVAITFLHAYANPVHEQRVRDILAAEMPGITISISSEVCPEVREYERASTTVANAYVQPLMAGYLGRLKAALAEKRFSGALYLVTSGGGLTSLETAQEFPVRLVESGPAGGAIFAAQCAVRLGEDKVLSFDMGGTTAKVCLVEKGQPSSSRFFEVDRTARFMKGSGLPLRIPVVEMVEIGAGGGSIAHLDSMKRVVVGPESASSVPGPACYGLGGTRPAVTDADVVLGLIQPDNFAGGSMTLDVERAAVALQNEIGEPLGLSSAMAASAVYEIVCENMASAARIHAAERGAVIGHHTMIAFGGAAPLHAVRVAEKLGIRRIVIPANAGVGSAVGFLAAPVSFEIVRSRPARLDSSFDAEGISALLDDMTAAARAMTQNDATSGELVARRSGFMRYVGQGHEIVVTLPDNSLQQNDLPALRAAFEAEYARQFERVIPHAPVEILNWSVCVSGPTATLPPFEKTSEKHLVEPTAIRQLFDRTLGRTIDMRLFSRSDMRAGSWVSGPAIIVESETTTYISTSYDAGIDGSGNIVLEMKETVG